MEQEQVSNNELSDFLEPDMDACFDLWWSYFWRSILWGLLGGGVFAVIAGAVAMSWGASVGQAGLITWFIAWQIIMFVPFRSVLKNENGRYKVFVIKRIDVYDEY